MSQVFNDSADIVIADPPYNIGKDFGNNSDKLPLNEYLSWSRNWINLALDKLKDSGTMFIYGYPEILAHLSVLISENYFRRWLVWHYTNKNTPHSGFWQRSYESILTIWKSDKRIFNQDLVREPYTETFLKNCAGKVRKSTKGRFSKGDKETIYQANQNGALPRDVICIPALAGGAGASERLIYCKTCDKLISSIERKLHSACDLVIHPTQKPSKLTRKLILSCKPIDRSFNVLIPFCGSGSECKTVLEMGGNFLAFEINSDYVKLANRVIEDVSR